MRRSWDAKCPERARLAELVAFLPGCFPRSALGVLLPQYPARQCAGDCFPSAKRIRPPLTAVSAIKVGGWQCAAVAVASDPVRRGCWRLLIDLLQSCGWCPPTLYRSWLPSVTLTANVALTPAAALASLATQGIEAQAMPHAASRPQQAAPTTVHAFFHTHVVHSMLAPPPAFSLSQFCNPSPLAHARRLLSWRYSRGLRQYIGSRSSTATTSFRWITSAPSSAPDTPSPARDRLGCKHKWEGEGAWRFAPGGVQRSATPQGGFWAWGAARCRAAPQAGALLQLQRPVAPCLAHPCCSLPPHPLDSPGGCRQCG